MKTSYRALGFYAAIIIAVFSYYRLTDDSFFRRVQQQQPISAQEVKKTTRSITTRAEYARNQSGNTLLNDPSLFIGSSSRSGGSLGLHFDLTGIPYDAHISRALLRITSSAESISSPLNVLVFAEKPENFSVDKEESLLSNKLLSKNYSLYSTDAAWNKDQVVELPDLRNVISEVLEIYRNKTDIYLVLKSIDVQKSQRFIYTPDSTFAPTLSIEYEI